MVLERFIHTLFILSTVSLLSFLCNTVPLFKNTDFFASTGFWRSSSLHSHSHLRRLSFLFLFFSLSLSLSHGLFLDHQISRFLSQSISISLCWRVAQEYIRRQLEEEQRQLEILQQQLLQEQALLLVTSALPCATTAPCLCHMPPTPHPIPAACTRVAAVQKDWLSSLSHSTCYQLQTGWKTCGWNNDLFISDGCVEFVQLIIACTLH